MNKDNRRGLNEVRVEKTALMKKMQENLEIHKKEYNEAYLGWTKKFHAAIVALNEAVLGPDLDVKVADKCLRDLNSLTKPVSHEDDYIETLELLEASRDDEFVLDAQSFNQFWRDNWRWKNDFSTSNARYS